MFWLMSPRSSSSAGFARTPTKIMTLIARNTYVAIGSTVIERMLRTCVFCCEHSGQRMPTGVGVMQSGQIGRPQFEHETPVSRSLWR